MSAIKNMGTTKIEILFPFQYRGAHYVPGQGIPAKILLENWWDLDYLNPFNISECRVFIKLN